MRTRLPTARLGPRIVLLSPHLDDGALSLGAGLRALARKGAIVTALTVMAGRPGSLRPAGAWDAATGFATEGDASNRRRAEDGSAWARLGVRCAWLDYPDQDYAGPRDDRAVWADVLAALEQLGGVDDLLVPGAPLKHPDHAWVAGLAAERGHPTARVRGYLEQPYGLWSRRPGAVYREVVGDLAWERLPAAPSDRAAWAGAVCSYSSQLPLLASKHRLPLVGPSRSRLLAEMALDTLRRGGDLVSRPLGPAPGLEGV